MEGVKVQNESLISWILAGVSAIIASLTGTIAFFYRSQVQSWKDRDIEQTKELVEFKAEASEKIKKLEARADGCEKDREALRIEQAVMQVRLNDLEARKANRDSINREIS